MERKYGSSTAVITPKIELIKIDQHENPQNLHFKQLKTTDEAMEFNNIKIP